MSFYFDNITKTYIRALLGVERPAWAPIEHEIIEVPGSAGGITVEKKRKVRILYVPVEIRGNNTLNLQKVKEDLAKWLIKDDPRNLVFPDEPDRVYYAEITGELNLDEIVEKGKGLLTFLCTNPFKYGPQLTFTKSASTSGTNTLIMNNPGTVEAYPEFRFIVKKPITHLDIIGPDKYMRIGRPVTVEETIVNPTETILSDTMRTLIGWTNAHNVDGGVIAGSFQATENGFRVSNFGTGEAWHGPALQKSISQPLEDFQVMMQCTFYSSSNDGVGRIELYLLDENGNAFGKLAFKDIHRYEYKQQAEARVGPLLGGTFIIAGQPADPKMFDFFTGILRLKRVKGKWEAYVANISNQHVGEMQGSILDESVSANLAGIKIHAGVSGQNTPAYMTVNHIWVEKINDLSGSVVPNIVQPGDEIVMDFKKDLILINGEDMKKLKGDFISSFFPIKPGDTALVISPGDAVDVEAKVRGPYH
ncbi:distal tail protein Dit [Sutcliffiella sp. FSL R7-0096]|uniref:distal tail protein Dit n=1 Tax=Sutcliffiella sp. FSL R7-0096 TaxID=2921670 RepID=UPI003159B59A